jgi:Ca-activated chloride channel homolog
MPRATSTAATTLAALAAATMLGVGLPAQSPQTPAFKSGTQLVSVFATVQDSQGRLVADLVQDDFQIFDNDRPQEILIFENQPQPITVVVMLDTSGSMTANIALLRAAAEQFLIRLLPADRARVGAFNDKIEFGSDFSDDRDDLIASLRDLDYGNGTRLWDAIAASFDELRTVEGRRVVLVFTDGDDTSSRAGLGDIVDRARAEDLMVYAIGLESSFFDGERMVRSRPDGGLRRVAEETGGGYFELKKTADLAPTFTRVAQELHSQYLLGFQPAALDGKVHRLALRLKQAGMTARARKSYLAEKSGDK